MSFLDVLVPPVGDPILDRLAELRFTDSGADVRLGGTDEATLGLIREVVGHPGTDLLLQFPRGQHDVAILVGLFLQLVRLGERHGYSSGGPGFRGPIVIIGMNTAVADRLHKVRIAGSSLSAALGVHRVRSDGRLIDLRSHVSECAHDAPHLLYLNTRVGWPTLGGGGVTLGAVVIDRTSSANSIILDSALAWARRHRAARILVVADLGDALAADGLRRAGRQFITWPWNRPLLRQTRHELGAQPVTTSLSTNVLMQQRCRGVGRATLVAPAIEEAAHSVACGLARARRLREPFPRPVAAAVRLYNALTQCWGSVSQYNQWSALDPRAVSPATLYRDLDSPDLAAFLGVWRTFGETHWADLRFEVRRLYDLIAGENPKQYMLGCVLDWLRKERAGHRIVVRVPNDAALHALDCDLRELGDQYAPDGEAVLLRTWGARVPWTDARVIDVHPTMPPPSRRSALWTGESVEQIVVCFRFERAFLDRVLRRESDQQTRDLQLAADELGLTGLPGYEQAAAQDVVPTLELDRRRIRGPSVAEDLGVDVSLMYEEILEEDKGERAADLTVAGASSQPILVPACPVILEPLGESWWIRPSGTVEVLESGRSLVYRGLHELRRGDTVIVPRGEGRAELFARLVEAAHGRSDVASFDVLFTRWRASVRAVKERHGTWKEVEREMRRLGSTLTWQSPRSWSEGTVIAPSVAEDIRRIGRLAGDPLIEHEYRRLDAMADEVRKLHTSLGLLISPAMAEAAAGGGPHLDRLADLLGGLDPAEFLDEFELRIVRAVGPVQQIPLTDVRRVIPPTPREIAS